MLHGFLDFEYPYLFFIFFLPFILNKLLSPRDLEQNYTEINFPYVKKIQFLQKINQKSTLFRSSAFSEIIFYLIWLLLTVLIMKPRIIDEIVEINSEGYDIILAVDISHSMAALDFSQEGTKTNRLDIAKKTVEEFILKRQGDRIGLVLFGKDSYLHIPLTFDIATVSKMLRMVDVGMAGDSTSIGDAIIMSLKSLKDRQNQSTAIILLTDGDDTSSVISPITAANLVKEYNIPIYTIAMGREDSVPFPTENGNIVMVQMYVNKDLLRQISDITGGEFFMAENLESLRQIYNHINKLKKTKFEVKNQVTAKYLHHYIIMVILLLLLLVLIRRKWAN